MGCRCHLDIDIDIVVSSSDRYTLQTLLPEEHIDAHEARCPDSLPLSSAPDMSRLQVEEVPPCNMQALTQRLPATEAIYARTSHQTAYAGTQTRNGRAPHMSVVRL